jgi:hypothetical protein
MHVILLKLLSNSGFRLGIKQGPKSRQTSEGKNITFFSDSFDSKSLS